MKVLRILFALLVLINLLVFAWHQSTLGNDDESREPQRLTEQKDADKLKLLTNDDAEPAAPSKPPANQANAPASAPGATLSSTATAPQPLAASPETKPSAICRLVSGFKLAEAKQWADASAGPHPELKFLVTPVVAAGTYDVLIAGLPGRDAAETKLKEVRALGITAPVRTAADGGGRVALIFASVASESEAKDYLQALQEKGVRSARVFSRPAPPTSAQVEISNLDQNSLKTIKDKLVNRSDLHIGDCPAK
ncbi:MAG TPA: SPOR domain-containing protein [Rhodocyclaceae bacterium]|jgi:hypothetical protein